MKYKIIKEDYFRKFMWLFLMLSGGAIELAAAKKMKSDMKVCHCVTNLLHKMMVDVCCCLKW